jgi:hypothetical protein
MAFANRGFSSSKLGSGSSLPIMPVTKQITRFTVSNRNATAPFVIANAPVTMAIYANNVTSVIIQNTSRSAITQIATKQASTAVFESLWDFRIEPSINLFNTVSKLIFSFRQRKSYFRRSPSIFASFQEKQLNYAAV